MRKVLMIALNFLTICISAQDQSNKGIPAEKKFTLENCLNSFDSEKVVKTSVGYQYWFVPQNFLDDGLTVKMSVVGPGQASHAPHSHGEEEIFFVLHGTARFYLNGETITGGAFTSFFCPANSEHGISNADSTELKYLVVRKYPVK